MEPEARATTVLRGGYGIYHDVSAMGESTGPYQNPPYANAYAFVSDNITPVRTLATGFPVNNQPVDPSNYRGDWTTIDPDSKQGRIQQWSINVEQQLPFNTIGSVAYAGTYGDRLFDKTRNLNTATPGPGFNPAARRPYPLLQAVNAALSRGWMKYNSLQMRLERRAIRGLYLLGSYTFSKATTNGVSGFGGDPGIVYYPVIDDDDVDAGSANTDLRHNFTLSTLYNLPFMNDAGGVGGALLGDWSVNLIFVAHSGYPLGMSMANNQSGTAFGNRPDRVCDGAVDDPTVRRWFDTSCFVAPAVGVLGNAARTTLFGPGRWNVDMALSKNAGAFQFRAEFFNVFNSAVRDPTPWSALRLRPSSSTVKEPRQVQLAVKYFVAAPWAPETRRASGASAHDSSLRPAETRLVASRLGGARVLAGHGPSPAPRGPRLPQRSLAPPETHLLVENFRRVRVLTAWRGKRPRISGPLAKTVDGCVAAPIAGARAGRCGTHEAFSGPYRCLCHPPDDGGQSQPSPNPRRRWSSTPTSRSLPRRLDGVVLRAELPSESLGITDRAGNQERR